MYVLTPRPLSPPPHPHETDMSGQDPFFAIIEDPKRPGKSKKVKKQIPAYLSDHDAMILARVRKSAYRLDMCLFSLFGVRFGWEAVIGLIPAAGDAIGLALAYLVFAQCCKVEGGLPGNVKMKMIFNILLDFAVGLVPFVGDLADAAYKCNTKNCRMLEVYLDKKYAPRDARDERDRGGVSKEERRRKRQSGIYTPNDPPPATVFEDFSDEEGGRRGGGREMQERGSSRREDGRQERRQETGRTRG